MQKGQIISKADFVVLEFLWFCRLCYDSFLAFFTRKKPITHSKEDTYKMSEKKHMIQLYTKYPENDRSRPTHFMKVFEIDSQEEERYRREKFENQLFFKFHN